MKETHHKVLKKIPSHIEICAVTKGRTIQEIEELFKIAPQIKIIAENRWPECQEKFKHFANKEKHFIGRIQTNKLNKILPLVDVIQSVDSLDLLQKISQKTPKPLKYTFQVNISRDPAKQGISPDKIKQVIQKSQNLPNVELIGLMTIGTPYNQEQYFSEFKSLFDNLKSFNPSLKVLSMGTSQDYQTAINCGSTMLRLGSCLFD